MSVPEPPADVDLRLERSLRVRWAGRIGGPVAALAVYALLSGSALSAEGRATLAIGTLMAGLWMTEAMPLPATSLLPIALLPIAGVVSIEEATAPYANRIVFLLMGGFMLGLAMQRWELHRRIALLTVSVVGTQPRRIIGGFMLATAMMSMWVSNTATAIMMLSVGTSVIALMRSRVEGPTAERDTAVFATALLLGIAYAASIGSIGTPIGTPPNLLLRGYLATTFGVEIGFGRWMVLALPIVAVFLPIAWFVLTHVLFRTGIPHLPGGRALIRRELSELGPPSRGEWTVFVVFVCTAGAWVLREPLAGWEAFARAFPFISRVDDAGIAIAAAILLFAIPIDARQGIFTLDWASARHLPWGVLLLLGGGLSLANAITTTGVDAWISGGVAALGALPTFALVVVVVAGVIMLTEVTSNTATAAAFLPVLGGIAVGIAVDPMLLVVPAALAASFAFMLPVATPPNAIVFATGHLTIAQMARAGLRLNIAAIACIPPMVYVLGPAVLGIAR